MAKTKKGGLSAQGRRNIIAAQKKRWAKKGARKTATKKKGKPGRPKGTKKKPGRPKGTGKKPGRSKNLGSSLTTVINGMVSVRVADAVTKVEAKHEKKLEKLKTRYRKQLAKITRLVDSIVSA